MSIIGFVDFGKATCDLMIRRVTTATDMIYMIPILVCTLCHVKDPQDPHEAVILGEAG